MGKNSTINFTVFSKCTFWETTKGKHVEEISISSDGNAEFLITWQVLGGRGAPAMRVSVFEDAFGFFKRIAPFFEKLADHQDMNPQPDQVIGWLIDFGFKESKEFYAKRPAKKLIPTRRTPAGLSEFASGVEA